MGRLHTVIEKVLEDISFNANEYKDQEFIVTAELVHEKLDMVVENNDSSRYILVLTPKKVSFGSTYYFLAQNRVYQK